MSFTNSVVMESSISGKYSCTWYSSIGVNGSWAMFTLASPSSVHTGMTSTFLNTFPSFSFDCKQRLLNTVCVHRSWTSNCASIYRGPLSEGPKKSPLFVKIERLAFKTTLFTWFPTKTVVTKIKKREVRTISSLLLTVYGSTGFQTSDSISSRSRA